MGTGTLRPHHRQSGVHDRWSSNDPYDPLSVALIRKTYLCPNRTLPTFLVASPAQRTGRLSRLVPSRGRLTTEATAP